MHKLKHDDPLLKQKEQGKDTLKHTQLQTVFDYLGKYVASASMVTYATGVPQKCITRYKRDLQKEGRLVVVKRKRCQITGRTVEYLTTDTSMFPKQSIQPTLFNL